MYTFYVEYWKHLNVNYVSRWQHYHKKSKTCTSSTINEINAYRLISDEPVLVGQVLGWQHGLIRTEQGDDWDGAVSWKAEEMIRLTSAETTVHGSDCECCQNERAGVTE